MSETSWNLPELLQRAFAAHQAGDLRLAEARYRMLVAVQPGHFEALHLLGVLAGQQGRHDDAERRIGEALAIDARSEAAHTNRAAALSMLSRFEEAGASYAAALAINPDHIEALYGRGNLLLSARQHGRALADYQAALALKPDLIEALSNRGIVLSRLGRHSDASASFAAALAVRSDHPEPWNNRGRALLALRRNDAALACFEAALAAAPGYAEAWNNRGSALLALGRRGEALASYDTALALAPSHLEAWSNRANAMTELRGYDRALHSAAVALTIAPAFPEALNNRGVALARLKRFGPALDSYDAALSGRPDYPEALSNRGSVLARLQRRGEAARSYEAALAVSPDHVDALYNRGNVLFQLLRHEEAVASYDRALQVDPGLHTAHSNKIFSLDFIPGLGFEDHWQARRGWFEAHGRKLARVPAPHANTRDPSRRLVLGYVSADFRQHSAAYIFGPILRRHDKTNFELVLYSNTEDEDEATAGFRRIADRWRSVVGWSDADLASQVRADRVDILIDLSGHTEGNRLFAFAAKPAPLQVTAWGHATGNGIPAIDYLFTDVVSVPASARTFFAEKIVDLPCSMAFEAPDYAPPVGDSPAKTSGVVTFGCLNRFSKISRRMLTLWSSVLHAVPGSRLLLKDRALDDPALRTFATEALAENGIATDRFELRGGSPHPDHLRTYSEIDIALDPFPQNGGLSTWESLWMGCPVVARLGTTISSRASAAILSAVGLSDWIAKDDEDYVALAVRKTQTLDALVELRQRLRPTVAASPAGSPDLYVRAAEAAFRDMWKSWCAADRADR